MIAEPYICIKGERVGDIKWLILHLVTPRLNGLSAEHVTDDWQPYADFEREKLNALGSRYLYVSVGGGGSAYWVTNKARWVFDSEEVIGYDSEQYEIDSESSRLLKRAEFLKAVCEKEGVEWLPKDTVVAKVLEKEWRKALVDFLSIPNAGIVRGEYMDREQYEREWNSLIEKFVR